MDTKLEGDSSLQRAQGGLRQLSDQKTGGDSETAGSDWHPLCIHLHRTAFCLQSPHLSTHSPAGVGRRLLQLLAFGEEEGALLEEDRASAQGCGVGVGVGRIGWPEVVHSLGKLPMGKGVLLPFLGGHSVS